MSEDLDPRCLWPISYGLYVIAARDGDKVNAQIANTVIQVSAEPPKILVAINKNNYTHDLIAAGKAFTATVLSENTPMTFIGKFGFKTGREVDKFEAVGTIEGVTGCPVVTDNAVSVFEAKVYDTADAGTHTVFLGDVVSGKVMSDDKPLTYAQYHAMKGRAPKNAPTYRGEAEKDASAGGAAEGKKGEGMKRYVCGVCGYTYDPAEGDPDNGVQPGTAFEDLPEDWLCPVCGAEKSEFSPE